MATGNGGAYFFTWGNECVLHHDVPGAKTLLKYWLPVAAWMLLIFSASTDIMSSQHTSRFLGPLLRWLLPSADSETIAGLQFAIRKCGHLSEYGVLSLLVWRALRMPVRNDPRPWDWRLARRTLLIAMLYAATDELHQAFVPSRYSTVEDVFIDASGAAFALGALWVVGRLRRTW